MKYEMHEVIQRGNSLRVVADLINWQHLKKEEKGRLVTKILVQIKRPRVVATFWLMRPRHGANRNNERATTYAKTIGLSGISYWDLQMVYSWA